MTTNYHTPIATGASNAPSTVNTPLSTLDSQISANRTSISSLETSTMTSAYAQTNGVIASGTTWAIDNSSGTFLAGADVILTISGVTYSDTVAANFSSSSGNLTVTNGLSVSIPDNTPIFQVPAGTSAIATLGLYNVKDPAYGAVGDGSTDDSTAIQAAIDACTAAGGGTVWFPEATYRIDTTLELKDSVILQGNGFSSILDIDTDISFIQASSGNTVSNAGIRDMRLVGTDAVGSSSGINLDTAVNCFIDNVIIVNARANGIRLVQTNYSWVRNCRISGPTTPTVDYAHINIVTSDDNVIENNICTGGNSTVYMHGIQLSGSRRNTVTGNHIYDVGHSAINMWGSNCVGPAWNIINNNVIDDPTTRRGSGVVVDAGTTGTSINTISGAAGTVTVTTSAAHDLLTGQYVMIVSTPDGDYDTTDPKRITVSNSTTFTYLDSPTAAESGGTIYPVASGNQVIGNNCRRKAVNGITVTRAIDTLVMGNTCTQNGNAGIECTDDATNGVDPKRTMIRDNFVSHNDNIGIELEADSDYTIISENYVTENGTDGILLTQSNYCQIIGNYVADNGETTANAYDGIELANAPDCTIANNIVGNFYTSNQRYGIRISNTSNNALVHGNTVSGSATDDISTADTDSRIRNNVHGDSRIKTISSGSVTTHLSYIILAAETGTADTLGNIVGGYEGAIVTLESDAGDTITVADGTNIFLSGSTTYAMSGEDTLTLIQRADGKWYEIARGDNSP